MQNHRGPGSEPQRSRFSSVTTGSVTFLHRTQQLYMNPSGCHRAGTCSPPQTKQYHCSGTVPHRTVPVLSNISCWQDAALVQGQLYTAPLSTTLPEDEVLARGAPIRTSDLWRGRTGHSLLCRVWTEPPSDICVFICVSRHTAGNASHEMDRDTRDRRVQEPGILTCSTSP